MRGFITFYPPKYPASCKRCKCKIPYSITDRDRPKYCRDCWAKATADDLIQNFKERWATVTKERKS